MSRRSLTLGKKPYHLLFKQAASEILSEKMVAKLERLFIEAVDDAYERGKQDAINEMKENA